MTITDWTTTSTTPLPADTRAVAVAVYADRSASALTPVCVLVQTDTIGNARAVLGYPTRDGDVLPRDEHPDRLSDVLPVSVEGVQSRWTSEEVRRAGAAIYDLLAYTERCALPADDIARVTNRSLPLTVAALIALERTGAIIPLKGTAHWRLRTTPPKPTLPDPPTSPAFRELMTETR